MKIKEDIIQVLRDSMYNRTKLALDLNVHALTVEKYVKENKEDGPLTKLNALMAISMLTRVPYNNLIEEPERVSA